MRIARAAEDVGEKQAPGAGRGAHPQVSEGRGVDLTSEARPAGPGLRLTGRRLRELGRPYRRATTVSTGVRVAVTATRVVEALLIARVLAHVLAGRGSVAGPIATMAGALAVRLILIGVQGRHEDRIAGQVRSGLRSRLYRHLTLLGPGYLTTRRTGDLETVVVGAVDALGDYYATFVPVALASATGVVGVLAWIAVLDPLTALVMAAAALVMLAAPILTARAFGAAGREFALGVGRLSAEYLDAIQGMVTLKAFNATGRWGRRLSDQIDELSQDRTALAGLANIHLGFASLGLASGTVLGVAFATGRATHHAVSGAALLAIVLLAREAFRPLGDLQDAFGDAYDAVARANGLIDLLDTEPAVTSAQAARAAGPAVGRQPDVVFADVTFAYAPDRAPALENVSFEIAPGETVALVGASGAGKSTVVSLLLRFFDPQHGTISVGGSDIRSFPPAELRALIAVTFQDSYLFHRSISDNLLLARPTATLADLKAAAQAANADEFIAQLPDGYDTVIHERGSRLSGGQRQRLAIARAVLADRAILVFDEPTSSVDAASETLITDALDQLSKGRTTIVIAHRLSTIARADRVLVIDAGRIVETGSPTDLKGGDGPFSKLIEAQQWPSR